ncbi:Pkinase-domain-containing protein [Peniophora sp. CONT]|nr:Pkinase-domain-containing protein [Peniophora sp. CONT]
MRGHKHTTSASVNQKAHLASAYNELGKELSSSRVRVVGNYTLGKTIGAGTYGKVRLGTHRLTSARVAIKQIPKAMSASLTREIHHHRQLHHPHVAQLFEVIATEQSIWLVTELCAGGELFDYLAEKGRLSEGHARALFGQLCLAVAYIHEKGIVHRDLKLENVLLDERCRVKLGDFGFTREWDKGGFLETFCGTTGYASPEMLEGQKYVGPEVDVWSLGVILYCLLTGGLPFDDDDEGLMRLKVIRAEFALPSFLTPPARDLLRSILQKDPAKRATIPQILAHAWFKGEVPTDLVGEAEGINGDGREDGTRASTDATSSSASASDDDGADASSATTPDPDEGEVPNPSVSRRPSEATIRNAGTPLSAKAEGKKPETVPEEDAAPVAPALERVRTNEDLSSPALPTRTPVRTKRRSVSSTLGDPREESPTRRSPSPASRSDRGGEDGRGSSDSARGGGGEADAEGKGRTMDFAHALSKPAPVIFGTALERDLLNSLSALGFDTGQVVHSVLSNACDSASAIWWMLKRRSERRALEAGTAPDSADEELASRRPSEDIPSDKRSKVADFAKPRRSESPTERKGKSAAASLQPITSAVPAPALAFIPPTPVTLSHDLRPHTPPRAGSPLHLLSASTTDGSIRSSADASIRSSASTPSANGGSGSTKGRAKRSGSVSIMQRATTALEAAGLVRKKSAEAVLPGTSTPNDKDKGSRIEKDKDSKRSLTGEKDRTPGNRPFTPDDKSVHSHHTFTRSPPLAVDLTPIPVQHVPSVPESPWVMAGGVADEEGTGSGSPRDTLTALPVITGSGVKSGHARNRGSLLSTFRMWFDQDRKASKGGSGAGGGGGGSKGIGPAVGKGKGKAPPTPGTVKRRASTRAKKRASMGSQRSSSVNSRRSSGASMLDTPAYAAALDMARTRSDASRRSFGSRTPNSEAGEFFAQGSSRPSSVLSYARRTERHRKSPSQSSAGSAARAGAASPYHRRGGSGGSTRVVRSPTAGSKPKRHVRSNSTASSIHSLTSSRRGSFYEGSETEGARAGSPFKRALDTLEETPRRASTFVAQKRNAGPLAAMTIHKGSSWKKAWGREPPGWAARPAVEVLAVLEPDEGEGEVRDVFSSSKAAMGGDEDEWVDEDDEMEEGVGFGYAGGLGQLPAGASPKMVEEPVPISPAIARGMGTGMGMSTGMGLGMGMGGGVGRMGMGMGGRREKEVVLDPAPENRRRGPVGKGGGFRAQPAVVEEEDEPEEE